MTEKMKLNDEMMEQVNGGVAEFDEEAGTISAIVMVNPYPEDEGMTGIWEDCQRNGETVYELSDGRLAVGGGPSAVHEPGDKVMLIAIRGAYGWEIRL